MLIFLFHEEELTMAYVALLGFGTVGSGVAEVLSKKQAQLADYIGSEARIRSILDLRDFPDSPFGHLVVHDFDRILNDPEISVVAEMMGGLHPAYDYTKACLCAGKNVVTSNKEVVAKFGGELLQIAAAHGVSYRFEASVGGGIPIIHPMLTDLSPNSVISIDGILNGTTNYMLTAMSKDGTDYADILAQAQACGYAEANPDADVMGLDAARKIIILSALAFGKMLPLDAVHTEGITALTRDDFSRAHQFGFTIKLIAHAERLSNGKILAAVTPQLVRAANPLYGINDVFNGILVDTDMLGKVMFYGKGAGKFPTASAVVADITATLSKKESNVRASWEDATEDDIADYDEFTCPRMVTLRGSKDAADAVFGIDNTAFSATNSSYTYLTAPISETVFRARLAACDAELISALRIL